MATAVVAYEYSLCYVWLQPLPHMVSGEINYNELAKIIMSGDILSRGIPERRVIKAPPRVGRGQVLLSDLRAAQKVIHLRLTTKFDSVREALRFVDQDGSGTIDREEIKEMLKRFNILEYTDFYTGQKRGEVSEAILDTFMEVCQGLSLNEGDGDTRVEARSILACCRARACITGALQVWHAPASP